ncbi:ABC transporter substrate-binding protein [Haladaptatus sp. NG-SE-30]
MPQASNGRECGSSDTSGDKRRKFLKTAGMAATGSMALLAGCSSGDGGGSKKNGGTTGSSKSGKTTVKYALGTIHDESAVKKFEQRVNKKIPDNITFEMTEIPGSTDQDTQKLKTWLSSGRSDPDIFNLDGIYTQQFAAAGWLLPIEDYVDKKWTNQFIESAIRAGSWNGKLYAPPQFADAGGLYYNKKLLKNAGYSNPPTTRKELVEMATKAKQEADGDVKGFTWQGKQYEGLVCDWVEWVHAEDGWIFGNRDGLHKTPGKRSITIDSQKVVDATKGMRDLIYTDKVSPQSVVSMTEGPSAKLLQQGNAVFHRNWFYLPPILDNKEKSKIAGDWGYAPMPGNNGCLGNENYGINKNSKNPKAAVKVVKTMASDPEILKANLGNGSVPAISKYWSRDDFKSIKPLGPYLESFGKVLSNSIARPSTPIYSQESDVFQKAVSNVLNKNATAQQALSNAKKKLKDIESNYQPPK